MGDTEETPAETPETPAPVETPEAPKEEAPAEEPAAEAKEGEESEAEEAKEGEGGERPKPEGHKRAGGFQRKIERLERALQEKDAVISRLSGQQPQAPTKEKTSEEKAVEYVESLVEKRIAAREAQQRQNQAQAEFARRTQEVRASNPDFDDAIESVSHIAVPQYIQEALLTAEAGPVIMYQLAKSPAELARISALPPLDAAREIGRLEAKLASGAAPQKPKPAARPPAPPTSVNGSAANTRSLEDLPISEYKRRMRSGGS